MAKRKLTAAEKEIASLQRKLRAAENEATAAKAAAAKATIGKRGFWGIMGDMIPVRTITKQMPCTAAFDLDSNLRQIRTQRERLDAEILPALDSQIRILSGNLDEWSDAAEKSDHDAAFACIRRAAETYDKIASICKNGITRGEHGFVSIISNACTASIPKDCRERLRELGTLPKKS